MVTHLISSHSLLRIPAKSIIQKMSKPTPKAPPNLKKNTAAIPSPKHPKTVAGVLCDAAIGSVFTWPQQHRSPWNSSIDDHLKTRVSCGHRLDDQLGSRRSTPGAFFVQTNSIGGQCRHIFHTWMCMGHVFGQSHASATTIGPAMKNHLAYQALPGRQPLVGSIH